MTIATDETHILTDAHWRTLAAVIDRLIPPDEFPGGWQAGVGDYLRRQFDTDLAGKVALYQGGLDALNGETQRASGRSFAELDADAQDALLSRIESGEVSGAWPAEIAPRPFFHMLVSHAMEGFYADPGNGGNHKGVSWEMIGFEVRG